MSHANGVIRFNDREIMFFEYNGTSDVCHPKLWRTHAEVVEHWRENNPWRKCNCRNPPEQVEAYNDYGGGTTWTTYACRKCMVLTVTEDPLEQQNHQWPNKPDWINLVNWQSV